MKHHKSLEALVLTGILLLQLSPLCFQSPAASGDVDLSFDPGSGLDGPVNAIAVQPDGKVIIGGDFHTVKGLARRGVARLNADGSGDSSFFYAPYSVGTYPVHSLALQADGKLLVGSEFYNFGFMRYNMDGTPDTIFNDNSSAAIAPFAYYGAAVNTIAVQPDGKVFYAGDGLLRLNSDGTLDTTFNSAEYGALYAIALQPDGKIIISGYFESGPNGPGYALLRLNSNGDYDNTFVRTPDILVSSIAPQADGKMLVTGPHVGGTYHDVARLNSDGTLDATYNVTGGTAGGLPQWSVSAAALEPDGKLIIGGVFTSINGQARTNLARLNPDGTLDLSFQNAVGATGVRAIVPQTNGTLFIGGDFITVNSTNPHRVARLSANGSNDNSFDPGQGFESGNYSVVLQPDGKVLIGGLFTFINGTNRYGSARLNADGSRDDTFVASTNFNPNFSGLQGDCLPNSYCTTYYTRPSALVVQSDGKVLIGGYTYAQACDSEGCVDFARGFLIRVNADGSPDSSFVPLDGYQLDGQVQALGVQPDGKIVLGGQFHSIQGTIRQGIARLNSNGSLDMSFAPDPGIYGVFSLALQPDGNIITCGAYTIARLSQNGSREACFNPVTDGTVFFLKLQPEGKVLVGGSFATVNGVSRNGIARLNPNGSLDGSFNSGTGADGTVSSIALQSDGRIVIGGSFLNIDGLLRPHVARLLGGSGSPSRPPLRVFSSANNAVTVAWPSSSAGANLEQTTNLSTIHWVSVTNVPATLGSENQVSISSPAGQRFFRLFVVAPPPPPPPAPKSVTAAVGNGFISLTWTALPEALAQRVLRATNYNGPFTVIASPSTTNYTDSTVVNGSLYYYVVSVTYPCGESATSYPPVGGVPYAPAPAVHVESITMSFVPQGAKFSVRAVVKLADQAGAPVNGATVTGNFNGSFNNASRTGVTASDGYATIMSSSTIKNGTITFTVVKITAGSLIYNPDANVVTSATISR